MESQGEDPFSFRISFPSFFLLRRSSCLLSPSIDYETSLFSLFPGVFSFLPLLRKHLRFLRQLFFSLFPSQGDARPFSVFLPRPSMVYSLPFFVLPGYCALKSLTQLNASPFLPCAPCPMKFECLLFFPRGPPPPFFLIIYQGTAGSSLLWSANRTSSFSSTFSPTRESLPLLLLTQLGAYEMSFLPFFSHPKARGGCFFILLSHTDSSEFFLFFPPFPLPPLCDSGWIFFFYSYADH